MKKLILLPLILVLCSCASNQVTTTEAALQTPLMKPAKPPKTDLVALELPAKPLPEKRRSILQMTKDYFWGKKINEAAKKTGEANNEPVNESLLPRIARYIKKGIASWYGPGFHGRKTANGEIFNMYEMTAAHKTLPIPSYAQVTNLENNKTVIVRVNDRGPYVGNRLLDLSYAAARKIGIQQEGTGKVEIKVISPLQALPHIQKTAESQNKNVYFQLGSFGSQKKALKLQDKVAAYHLPEPTIRASRSNKLTTYKVQMGPIKSQESAVKLSTELAKIGIKQPQIITASRQN